MIVGYLDIYYAKKILNYFRCVEVRIFVQKWIIYEAHILPRSLVQSSRFETNSLCLNTPLSVNKNFKILIIFIEIYLTVWLLCSHHLTTCIIFQTRRPNTEENVSYVLDFYVSSDDHFSHFDELKSTFFPSLHFAPQVTYKRVSGVWNSVIVYRTEIMAKTHFRMVDTSNMPVWNIVIYIQINVLEFIMNLIFKWVLLI